MQIRRILLQFFLQGAAQMTINQHGVGQETFPPMRLWKQVFAPSLLPGHCLLVSPFRGYGTILAEGLILFFNFFLSYRVQ